MHAKQGTKTVTEFAKELDQLATQCQFDKNPYTTEWAKKDALTPGHTSDIYSTNREPISYLIFAAFRAKLNPKWRASNSMTSLI